MEKLTIFFVIFIAFFLIYSFIKSREKETGKKESEIKKENHGSSQEEYFKYVIVAAIAAVMDGKKHKIRNIFLEKEDNKEKKISSWKILGRHHTMQRRDRVSN